jgi:hypothetical protein
VPIKCLFITNVGFGDSRSRLTAELVSTRLPVALATRLPVALATRLPVAFAARNEARNETAAGGERDRGLPWACQHVATR